MRVRVRVRCGVPRVGEVGELSPNEGEMAGALVPGLKGWDQGQGQGWNQGWGQDWDQGQGQGWNQGWGWFPRARVREPVGVIIIRYYIIRVTGLD